MSFNLPRNQKDLRFTGELRAAAAEIGDRLHAVLRASAMAFRSDAVGDEVVGRLRRLIERPRLVVE